MTEQVRIYTNDIEQEQKQQDLERATPGGTTTRLNRVRSRTTLSEMYEAALLRVDSKLLDQIRARGRALGFGGSGIPSHQVGESDRPTERRGRL
jgi:hypothetical protein